MYHSAIAVNQFIYIFGGIYLDQVKKDKVYLQECEKYDIKNNKWTSLASMKKSTFDATLCTFNNKLKKFINSIIFLGISLNLVVVMAFSNIITN